MLKDENREQDVKISEMKTNICWIKRELTEIKIQMFNHIPTQITKLENNLLEKFKTYDDKIEKSNGKADKIKNTILWGFIVFIVLTIITQVILRLYI